MPRNRAIFFHSSALFTEYSPNAERLYSPSGHGTLHRGRVWATLGDAARGLSHVLPSRSELGSRWDTYINPRTYEGIVDHPSANDTPILMDVLYLLGSLQWIEYPDTRFQLQSIDLATFLRCLPPDWVSDREVLGVVFAFICKQTTESQWSSIWARHHCVNVRTPSSQIKYRLTLTYTCLAHHWPQTTDETRMEVFLTYLPLPMSRNLTLDSRERTPPSIVKMPSFEAMLGL
ncbi:hypothetical protein SCLCIDRAFT_10479 [Scleroderma citrinum Foug A]|uniref:Uncharacterized protein n=1 Tax=Scleroderma citrinum Foug A TaxID=1036808 RepID=A0A0C2ZYA2_9AGAM|nr:hypothetical protein SCLCIDRAFT_10479 [Scleroderma citrinum Foug A]